jgi:hypothetical protein
MVSVFAMQPISRCRVGLSTTGKRSDRVLERPFRELRYLAAYEFALTSAEFPTAWGEITTGDQQQSPQLEAGD